MKDNLVLLPGVRQPEDPVTLEQAELDLRERAKTLGAQIDRSYWELGRTLYEIYDGLPGGFTAVQNNELTKEARRGLYQKWGYTSFEEYCEKEVNLQRRTASSLRYAYWWFEHELKLPTEIKDRLLRLGRSKLYKLAGFVTMDNVISWMDRAAEMTVEELGKAIKTAKGVKAKRTADDNYNEADDLFEYGNSDAGGGDTEHRAAPAPETMHNVSTSLYDGQFKTWEQALERAKGLTGSDKISHNLEMICLDYLASNDFMNPEDDLKAYLAKQEQILGVKIIAVDPQSGKPKYGGDLLWLMVNARVAAEQADKQAAEPKLPNPDTVPSSRIKAADQPPQVDDDPPPSF